MRAYLIKAILLVFSVLPLPATHVIGIIAGWLLYLAPTAIKQISSINLQLCFPSLDKPSRKRLLRNSLIETAKAIAELGPLWYWRKERLMALVKKTSGEEALEHALKQGQGVILAIPHLGTWEMVGLYCSAKYPMTSLYRPPRIIELDSLARMARGRFGAHLVPTDMSGVRSLYHALTRGELVAILPDQEPAMDNGLFIPFYGIPAYTMTLLQRIASSSKAPVFFTYAERLPAGRGYHLHFISSPHDIRHYEQPQALLLMNNNIEMCINKIPEQYQWGYKRFRKRPAGVSDFY
jgi:KDO2-lipid IV(A) lauroyltransferase